MLRCRACDMAQMTEMGPEPTSDDATGPERAFVDGAANGSKEPILNGVR